MQEWERKTYQPETLEDVIFGVLEHHDGLCMDEAEDRGRLAQALHQAVLAFLNRPDPDKEANRQSGEE